MVSFVALLVLLVWVVCSTALQLANKALLGLLVFPGLGLLAVAQNLVTLLVCLMRYSHVKLPEERRVVKQVMLLGLSSGVSQILGLAAGGYLTLSMFGVLRRTSLLVTLVVGLWFGEKHGLLTKASILVMTFGAVVASFYDVSFHAIGYAAVLLDNFFTVLQRQLFSKSAELSWETVLLGQTMVALPMSLLFCLTVQPDATLQSAQLLMNSPLFSPVVGWFAACSVLGILLHLSVIASVARVSPLTLSVAGATKNNVLAIASLVSHSLPPLQNLIGIGLSIAGNLVYIWSKAT